MNFTIDGGSSLGWLKDKDDASCNEGPTQAVTVTLDTPIPLTWLRVVVSDTGNGNDQGVKSISFFCLNRMP